MGPNDLLPAVLDLFLVALDLLLVVLDLPMVTLDLPHFDLSAVSAAFAKFLVVLDLPGLSAPGAVDRPVLASVRFLVVLNLPSWFLISLTLSGNRGSKHM